MPNPNTMDVKLDGRLEVLLKSYCERKNAATKFPRFGGDRFAVYCAIKQALWQRYYRDVSAGLNTTEALEKNADIAFTHHDASHVDDVIERMAWLLGHGTKVETPAISHLSEYELFVLLVACLVHDAGNRDGRKGHSNRAWAILNDVGKDKLSVHEIRVISSIADAHGGHTTSGEQDTIRPLRDRAGVEGFNINPSRLAAILRFADELADNPRRGSSRRAENSKFANLYCERINTNIDYVSQWVSIEFVIHADELKKPGKDESGKDIYFLDYIYGRLQKTELERRYCSKFLQNFASYNSIRVVITFYNVNETGEHEEAHLPLDNICFEMADHGFPSDDGNILPDEAISGAEVARIFASGIGSLIADGRDNNTEKGVVGWMKKILSKFTNQRS